MLSPYVSILLPSTLGTAVAAAAAAAAAVAVVPAGPTRLWLPAQIARVVVLLL